MSNASQILPLVVGAINDRENLVKAKLKCPPTTGDSGDPLSGLDLDVLFPKRTNKVVPLAGGAVVKIELGSSVVGEGYNEFESSIVDSVNKKISIIEDFMKTADESADKPQQLLKQLEMHVAINKFLETAPFIQRKLHKYSIPTITLSNVLVSDPSASSINKEIDDRKKINSRIPSVAEVGALKFIPIETISAIYSRIVPEKGASFTLNTGLSGVTFGERLSGSDSISGLKTTDDSNDEAVCKAILDIFPIFKIEEAIIEGERSRKSVGFYTIVGDSVYVKMPDLSGRDAAGDSSNIYEIGEDADLNYGYIFELFIKKQYSAIAFDYKAPPVIDVDDNTLELSGEKPGIIEISPEGINQGTRFFLSPILKSSGLSAANMPAVKSISDANEVFSIPNLTVPFYSSTAEGSVIPSDNITAENLAEAIKGTYPSSNSPEETPSLSVEDEKVKFTSIGGSLSAEVGELGVPINSYGANASAMGSQSDILGIMNRAEIVLGRRDNKRAHRRNNRKYFADKIYAARNLMASITPNILTDPNTQVPKIFIEGINRGGILTFESTTTDSALGLDFFGDKISGEQYVEFALYAIDDLGQIARAPGANIRLQAESKIAVGVDGNGFAESGVVLRLVDPIIMLTISLDGIDEISGIKIYTAEIGGDEITPGFSSEDLEAISVAGGTARIFLPAERTWADIVGQITGIIWLEINGEGPRVPIYISGENEEPPEEPKKRILFKKEDRLSAPKFSGSVDSIPVLLDRSKNAEFKLKYYRRVFKEGLEAYAYFAILDTPENRQIIEEDIAWVGDSEIVKEVSIEGANYLLFSGGDFQEAYKLGSSNFQRLSSKKVSIKFPGPFSGRNISRFSAIQGNEDNYAGYIIIRNEKFPDSKVSLPSGDQFDQTFTKIPIGKKPGSNEDVSAFIDPPHIVGMAAKISGNNDSFVSNIDNIKEFEKDLRFINTEGIQIAPIVAADSLNRLSIIFKGSHSDRRKSKLYTAYIGAGLAGKKLKSFRTTIVRESDKPGLLVLNYKGIDSISNAGWTDISIQKKDKRFNVTYDSTVYGVSTINLINSESEESARDFFFEQIDGQRRLKEDKSLFDVNGENFTYTDSASIFPYGGNPLAGIPYVTSAISNARTPIDLSDKSEGFNVKSNYFVFRNPIKMYPDFGLNLGANIDGDEYGIVLTDTDVSSKPYGEVAELSSSGSMEVLPSIDDIRNIGDNLGEKVGEAKAGLQETAAAAQSTVDELTNRETDEPLTPAEQQQLESAQSEVAEAESQIQQLKESETALSESVSSAEEADTAATAAQQQAAEAEAAQQAAAAAGADGEEDGALDGVTEGLEDAAEAADAAAAAVQDAAAAVEAALAQAQALLDLLSSMAMLANAALEDLESELSSYGFRTNEFVELNVANVSINKDSSISTSVLEKAENPKEAKLTMFVRYGLTSAIKFNTPEIISLKKDGQSREIFPNEFSTVEVTSGNTLILKTIGTNKDTKVEINKIRVSKTIDSEEGIFKNLKVTIKDIKKYTFLDNCIEIALSNDNENRLKLGRQLGNDIAINLDDKWPENIFGGRRNKQGPAGELRGKIKENYLKFTAVTLDGIGAAKEFMQSFCDLSFHLTAELSLQLRNFKVLLIPIKVILCIIDVICALLHPIRLAFAIVRLFLCLYDLILLLPQLAVPAMLLALLLHIIELLLCVIIKVLSIVNAINEIISAIETAVEEKDYPAIVALEETINEHLFSLEADLSVLEPILEILALFIELLQLIFAFPCQVGSDEDDEACIDPSQLAGLIISKVAPRGRIEPDALLPMAQTYTTLPLSNIGSKGNTPESSADSGGGSVTNASGTTVSDVLVEPGESGVSDIVVASNQGGDYGGNDLTGISDSSTGDPIQIGEDGFFKGDLDEDGQMDNINYNSLRFKEDFEATFGISFTKTSKKFNIFTGPDPRIVEFEFNERGLTNALAFNWFFALFFRKKTIDELQTLDSPPAFVVPEGNSLKVNSGSAGFTSPFDGASDINSSGAFDGRFLRELGDGLQPRPLTVTLNLMRPELDPETFEYVEVFYEEEKTFENIPSIALVDDEFNVYFVEQTDTGGGIKTVTINGKTCIESINAKMINFPTAPKKKFSREEREVYRGAADLDQKSSRGGFIGGIPLGQEIVYEQANANWLLGVEDIVEIYEASVGDATVIDGAKFNSELGSAGTAQDIFDTIEAGDAVSGTTIPAGGWGASGSPGPAPFPEYRIYNWAEGSKKEQEDIGNALDEIKVFDFPQFYIVDMRHLVNEIEAACGSRGPTQNLTDAPNFTPEGEAAIEDLCNRTAGCVTAFKDMFLSQELDESGVPVGIITKMRSQLGEGRVPDKISQEDIVSKYNEFRECLEGVVEDTCEYVINPLSTSFLVMEDEDETPLTDFVNPEQRDLEGVVNIVEEFEFDEELSGLPKITGAMEYASGIGDSAAIKAGEKSIIKIIPRDCYDDPLPPNLDLTKSIKIDFIKDDTEGAELVPPDNGDEIFVKNGSEYTFGITAPTPGKVQIRATVCSVTIKAVTNSAIRRTEDLSQEVDCVDDITEPDEQSFAPGQLIKVDRILTLIFVKNNRASGNYGDSDRDKNEKSAIPNSQVFGTNLEN